VDPDIFHDADTDRWYMYFGSSNLYPILRDRARSPPSPVVYRAGARAIEASSRGAWMGAASVQDHRDTITPFIEGAAMTKYRGKY